jgi:microcystin-dependent protein
MKLIAMICTLLFSFSVACAQNVGIGTPTPAEKLDVNGNIKAIGLTLTTGGTQYDFLMKNNATGQVGFKKGHGALGIHYIIALDGTFPVQGPGPGIYNVTMVGEIKMFAGNFPPRGWAFCDGQLLDVNLYPALFILMGTTYGGDGLANFAVPDLRGSVPVGPGTSTVGYEWLQGEKSN